MVKWQQVSIGIIVSLSFLLGGLLNLSGVSYSDDGDKTCTDCFSEIKVNSTYWEVKVEHAGEDKNSVFKKRTRSRTLWVNLDKINELVTTDPAIKVDILVPAIKRTSTIKHDDYGYLRPLKDGDTLIKRNTKSRPSPSRIILHAENVNTIIKWNFDLEHWLIQDINIDPVWFGIKIDYLQECSTERKRQNTTIRSTCSTNQTITHYDNSTNPKTSYDSIYLYNFTCITGYEIRIKNTTTCRNVGVELEGEYGKVKIENWEKLNHACKIKDFNLCCDSLADGNGDGILTSGESGICYDIRDLSVKQEKKDSPSWPDVRFK